MDLVSSNPSPIQLDVIHVTVTAQEIQPYLVRILTAKMAPAIMVHFRIKMAALPVGVYRRRRQVASPVLNSTAI
jgi:hypothetical protein